MGAAPTREIPSAHIRNNTAERMDSMKKGKKHVIDALPLIWPYILISGILLALFMCGIFAYYRVTTRDAEQAAASRVDALSDEVYTRVTSYRKACDVLAASNVVQSFAQSYAGDANTAQAAVNSLQQELSNVVGIAHFPYTDAEVYYPQEQVIVSVKGVCRGEVNCADRLEAQSGDILWETLRGINSGNAWAICYGNGKAWLVRQLTGYSSSAAYIILEFALDQLVPISQEEGLVLIGDDSTQLYTSGNLSDDFVRTIRTQVQLEHRFTYHGDEYAAYRCIFSVLRTEIIIAVSINQIIANTSSFLKITLLLGAIFSASLVLIFHAMYKQVLLPYRYLAEATWVDSETDNPRNILTLARSNLLSLKSQQETAQEEKKLLIHLGVGDLLQQVRMVPEDPGLRTASRCLSLAGVLPGQRYLIFAAFQIERRVQNFEGVQDDWAEQSPLSILDEVLRELLFTGRVGVIATLEQYYVVIATCQDGDTEEKLDTIVNRLAQTCQQRSLPAVAATRPFIGEEAGELRTLVRHTMNDVNYLYFWQKERVEDREEENAKELVSFFKAMRNLINRLDSQDYTGAKTMFAQIMEDNLPRTAQDFQITKYRIYGMIEMLIAAISEQSPLGEDTIERLDFEKRLYETDTLSSFRSTTEQVFMELIDIRQQCDTGEGTQKKIENVRAYIDDHYTENSLTATSVAEHFNLSSSYLSREFKRIVGCNMLEYIQKLRVDQAKKLLANYSVKDAAQKAGFWDSQGLVRVFKKYEGITPGEYKKSLQ